MTLDELKAEMNKIMSQLKALQERVDSPEKDELRLQRAGELQARGKILGDQYRAIRLKQQEARGAKADD